ncbi:MAG TPA: MATE family efflux transporter [Gammaproteobacteria bacterium]|nr:MATE family efflux transporter [Gammaproteobacteria bacterium]
MSLGNHDKSKDAKTLTRHPTGSIRELWTLSYPLMLSALSGTLMLFCDRIILAHYHTDAMNAAASASMVFFTFIFAGISIAGIAEVLVGQYNGAQKWEKIAEPVWAMIWFSSFLVIPFIGIGIFGSPYLLANNMQEYGVPYLTGLMFSAPLFALVAALSAFFIGRGQVALVTYSVAIGNVLNFVLNLVFVFGVEGYIPAMGTLGSSLGTGIAQATIALILFALFLSKTNRVKFGTGNWRLHWGSFRQCMRIGLPNSLGHMAAITAWTIVLHLLASTSFEHITVFTIGQSIWILFSFITDGSSKAMSAVAANLIGSNNIHKIKKVLVSGILLQCIYAVFLAVPLLITPHLMIDLFIPDVTDTHIQSIKSLLAAGCFWLWIAFVGDAITWVIAGILTAAGDTIFIMIMSTLASWIFGMLPIYIMVVKYHGAPNVSLNLIALFTTLTAISFYLRYKTNHWERKALLIA